MRSENSVISLVIISFQMEQSDYFVSKRNKDRRQEKRKTILREIKMELIV